MPLPVALEVKRSPQIKQRLLRTAFLEILARSTITDNRHHPKIQIAAII